MLQVHKDLPPLTKEQIAGKMKVLFIFIGVLCFHSITTNPGSDLGLALWLRFVTDPNVITRVFYPIYGVYCLGEN